MVVAVIKMKNAGKMQKKWEGLVNLSDYKSECLEKTKLISLPIWVY